MNTIFTIIALPITLIISTICFLFAMLFEESFQAKDGVPILKRVLRESNNLALSRFWQDMSPMFNAVISCIVYYAIFG